MSERTFKGIAASAGIAIGPAFFFAPWKPEFPQRAPGSMDEEMRRFETACVEAVRELEAIRAAVLRRADAETAAIFEAHKLMVQDPMLSDSVRAQLSIGQGAEGAILHASQELASMLASVADPLIAAREADMRDVGRRLLRILLGKTETSIDDLNAPAVIVAHELTPSDTVGLRPELTLGFCTTGGGLTSHVSILARTLGLPAVVGLGAAAIGEIRHGASIVLDGRRGAVTLDPTRATLARYEAEQQQTSARSAQSQAAAAQPAATADGRRVEVAANIGDTASAREAVRFGAEGVGLLRTEFLYLRSAVAPTEEQQIEAYRSVLAAMGERPVIIRTLDIGGDKPPQFLKFEPEQNPFLGWRAIRICLDDPLLFKTQLRAILRAAVGHRAMIMFPMISSIEELRAAKGLLNEARAELKAKGLDYALDVPVGIMVETPAAAVQAEALARECDFLSLGTNDLTQYALAVDRTNARVARLFQPLHPAVLQLVKMTIEAAHSQGKWAGMCGELAGTPMAIPILLGLGLDEFSMAPRSIPEAKRLIGLLTAERAAEIARRAVQCATAAEVEILMAGVLEELSG